MIFSSAYIQRYYNLEYNIRAFYHFKNHICCNMQYLTLYFHISTECWRNEIIARSKILGVTARDNKFNE